MRTLMGFLFLGLLLFGCDDDPVNEGGDDATTTDVGQTDGGGGEGGGEAGGGGAEDARVTPDTTPPDREDTGTGDDASTPEDTGVDPDASGPEDASLPEDMGPDAPTTPVCGDGNLDEGEACDDGNTDPGDGCDADCALEPACGDGNLDEGEACDDGNTDPGDGCDADCALEPYCGDGNLDEGEACDDGNTDPGDGCSPVCALEAFCGDGNLDDGEECDDGGNAPGDGCDAFCALEPFCGDGDLDEGEECDDGGNIPGDGCDPLCALEPFCGDGDLDEGEECDDGGNVPGDGCDALCFLEPYCGDGDLDEGEACDDGNNDPGDGCDADCALEPYCGDGNLDEGEACDDGNTDPGDGCDAFCALEPYCGDGNLDEGEECDDGNDIADDLCDNNCARVPSCGDGFLDEGEACDDGNIQPNDGCDASCAIELPRCGDGRINQAGEECDDGNPFNADGCSSSCLVEPVDVSVGGAFAGGFEPESLDRFIFTLEGTVQVTLRADDAAGGCVDGLTGAINGQEIPDLCAGFSLHLDAGDHEVIVHNTLEQGVEVYAFYISFSTECGDGVLEMGEACDDGNVLDGDGCDPLCALECGNGQLDGDEACDDGNTDPGDGCDADCQVEATDITGGGQFPGSLNQGEQDIYRFSLETPIYMEAFTHDGQGACPGDTLMGLFLLNPNPIALAQNDNSADLPPCSRIEMELQPGDYELLVRGGPGGNALPAYVLEVVFRGECGNGVLEPGEECDDGNLDAADGCSGACTIELYPPPIADISEGGLGWFVRGLEPGGEMHYEFTTTQPATIRAWTGDRTQGCPQGMDTILVLAMMPEDGGAPIELIEDDNGADGDCSLINGPLPEVGTYRLIVRVPDGGSVPDEFILWFYFEPTCGNGVREQGEQCDDGNLAPNDDCDERCYLNYDDVSEGGAFDVPAFGAGNGQIYRLDLPLSATVDIYTRDPQGGCSNMDTMLFLFKILHNGEQQQVATNDDADGLLCSHITAELSAGTYEVAVVGWNGGAVPAHVLHIEYSSECGNGTHEMGEECDDGNAESGDLCDSTCHSEVFEIGDGGAFQNEVYPNQFDYYHFILELPARGEFLLHDGQGGCAEGSPQAWLRRNGGSGWIDIVGSGPNDPPGPCPQYVDVALQPGEYYFLVHADSDVPGYTLTNQFTGTCGNGVQEIGELCDDGNTSFGDECSAYCQDDLTGGGSVTQYLEPGEMVAADFRLDAVTNVDITNDDDALCRDHDPYMALLILQNQEWVVLAEDDDTGVGLCSRINTQLQPGDYRIINWSPAENNVEAFDVTTFLDFVL